MEIGIVLFQIWQVAIRYYGSYGSKMNQAGDTTSRFYMEEGETAVSVTVRIKFLQKLFKNSCVLHLKTRNSTKDPHRRSVRQK